MDGKGHTSFKTIQDKRDQWEKLKGSPISDMVHPGDFVGVDLTVLPSLEETRLGRYKKEKRADMTKDLISMDEDALDALVREVMLKRIESGEENENETTVETVETAEI